jgi:hypothetical protein
VQYIEHFRETYKAYQDNGTTKKVEEKDLEMDFFHGLDSGRYGVDKHDEWMGNGSI